ncbi:uncharacterized protein LOC130625783 [Hydractinia symbiolongicarpus]|uniref:uncharacterized protein LOC130625783 n=1 Tax=Hydractinia symbiolongicarpus TaxID=13093 RepID=UPI00254BF08A|nr:uncharacterized protein LOC130625783 [Hydractinia symbiolongicarpus]
MFNQVFLKFMALSSLFSFVFTLRCFQCSTSAQNCNEKQRKVYCQSHGHACLTLTYSYKDYDDSIRYYSEKKCVPPDSFNCKSYCDGHRSHYCEAQCCRKNLCNERNNSSLKQPLSFVDIFTFLALYHACVHLVISNP